MIRKTDGAVLIGGVTITPKLTKAQFLTSDMASGARVLVSHSRWITYGLSGQLDGGQRLGFSLSFEDDRLTSVGLSCSLPGDAKSWDDWSLEQELKRKAVHDSLLSQWLGSPPYRLEWGVVGSSYDDKAGFSTITVRYDEHTEA